MNIHKTTELTQDITDGFDSYESAVYDVGFGERIGIEFKLSAAPDTAAKCKVYGSISGDNFDTIKDSNGTDIILSLDGETNIYSLAMAGVNQVKIVGTQDGTGTSVLNALYISYK